MAAVDALEKDLAALKDKYIKKHNSTGISPDHRRFRPLWDYGERDSIIHYTHGGRRDFLLSLWDDREASRYQDAYTCYLDTLIEAAGELHINDLTLYNGASAAYDKAFMEKYEAKRKARKEAGKVC